MEANFYRHPLAFAEPNQRKTPVPAPVNNDFGGLILPPGKSRDPSPELIFKTFDMTLNGMSAKKQHVSHDSIANSVAAPAVAEPIPDTAGDDVVESHTASVEVPAKYQLVPLSDGSPQGHEVIDHSNPLEPSFLKTNKSGRKAKTTSASYEDRLQTFMLDLKSRPWPEFKSIVDAKYPEHLMPGICTHIKQGSVAAIESIDLSEILPASGGTSMRYHPLMQKVLTDCRLDIPESADLLAVYECITHLSRIYRLILLITPDCSLIKQEWIDETLRQHGEKCSRKMADGQKVTARQELHLSRDECQYLLNKLQAADSSNCGYALDVLVSALYSCKVKRPTPNADERCHLQGYQEIRPQNSFFVFARAFERCVSQGENIRQTSLRMYTKIVWRNVLTQEQRDLFQVIYGEMNELHSIIHPEYKYVPKFRAPGHHQPPAENGERSGAVKSFPSVSSQISQAKHAYADANADSRPAKRQCLAMEETTVAAQLVTSMPGEVPDTVAEDYFNGPHHMDCRYAWDESTVAPFYDPTLAVADQSDPFGLSQLPQDQPYTSFFPPASAVPYTAVQYAEAAARIFYTEPVYQMVDAPIPSLQPVSQMVEAPIPLPQDPEPQDDNNHSLEDSQMVDAPIPSALASKLLHDKNFDLEDFLNFFGLVHCTPMPALAVITSHVL